MLQIDINLTTQFNEIGTREVSSVHNMNGKQLQTIPFTNLESSSTHKSLALFFKWSNFGGELRMRHDQALPITGADDVNLMASR